MLILFDWKKVREYTNNDIIQILHVMFYITYRPIPKNKRDEFYHISKINWYGTSFLVNPDDLFEKSVGHTNKEIAEYIALAALRSYGEYKATRKTTLDLFKANVDKSTIENNRLLTLEDDKIHFKWE